jgi:hypothetical protein
MMMVLFVGLAVVQAVCLAISVRHYGRTRSRYDLLVVIVLAGLVYDNAVIALGGVMGEGSALYALNVPRYIIHGLATPTLMIWGYGVARRVGVNWAQTRRSHSILCGVVTLLLLLGVYNDIVALNLQPRVEQGITRYVNIGGIKGPPIASIITIVFLTVVGVAVWRRRKAIGLALGSGVMFVGAMAGAAVFGLGNAAEIAMSAGVLSGQRTSQL